MLYKSIGKEQTFIVIDFCDWDDFVKEQYPDCDYEIAFNDDINVDGLYKYDVFKKTLTYDSLMRIDNFKSGKFCWYITEDILQDLVNNDVIPEGKYLIDITW